MPLKLHTAPTGSVLTTAEAKLHLRVDHSEEDSLIDSMVASATEDAEHLMQRAILPQKWVLSLSEFPVCCPSIDLLRPPVSAIDSVTYVDSTGATVTLAPSEYQFVNNSGFMSQIVPAYGKSWPAARCQPDSVRVVFSTGSVTVPESIKTWIALRVGALYENRAGWTQAPIHRNEFADFLLDRYRTFTL